MPKPADAIPTTPPLPVASTTAIPDTTSSDGGRSGPADGTGDLESRVGAVGRQLTDALVELLAPMPAATRGPQAFATELGLDKVLGSRVLRAMRAGDPVATVHHAPGPEPLRRLVRAAGRRGATPAAVDAADAAVAAYERLIRHDIGDRSALDAIISAWLPEARRDFELRRKQAAYRAMSQLKGASADTLVATAVLHPADDGRSVDIVWCIGLLGLQRLRPGATVRCATRRMPRADGDAPPRKAMSLDGRPVESLDDARLDAFCVEEPARMDIRDVGETRHYLLADDAFGPGSATDLLFAEVNLAEFPRTVPRGSGRRGFVFAEISTPCKRLLFDVFVHDELYPGAAPQLLLHDTAFDGVVNLNDPTREADRLDLIEELRSLGHGIGGARDTRVPRHAETLRHVFTSMDWTPDRFRGHRCTIDYPVYGSQVSMAFAAPESDEPTAPR